MGWPQTYMPSSWLTQHGTSDLHFHVFSLPVDGTLDLHTFNALLACAEPSGMSAGAAKVRAAAMARELITFNIANSPK